MYLDLPGSPVPMKLVYELSKQLAADPEHVRLAQALTLDKSRPHMGLKGAAGLFASDEWWQSTHNGRLTVEIFSGVIERGYFAGQDSRWGKQVNSFVLRCDDGSLVDKSIYTNDWRDNRLFVPQARVCFAQALDELKQPASSGGADYSKVMLEMAVSLRPIG